MDIPLDRTIVLPHWIVILFASLCLRGWVLASIGMKGFWYSLRSRCLINVVLASTETIVYCRLDCRVLAGRYAWRALTNRDFKLLNYKDFLFTEHVHGNLFGESLSEQLSDCGQSCCQRASVRAAVVRVGAVRVPVRGYLSEQLLSERLLSEWLLSEWLLWEWLLSEWLLWEWLLSEWLLSEWLLSEWLLSDWLLSEWLLSEWLLSESQSDWSAVKVSD